MKNRLPPYADNCQNFSEDDSQSNIDAGYDRSATWVSRTANLLGMLVIIVIALIVASQLNLI